jgi:hypothetical protein
MVGGAELLPEIDQCTPVTIGVLVYSALSRYACLNGPADEIFHLLCGSPIGNTLDTAATLYVHWNVLYSTSSSQNENLKILQSRCFVNKASYFHFVCEGIYNTDIKMSLYGF